MYLLIDFKPRFKSPEAFFDPFFSLFSPTGDPFTDSADYAPLISYALRHPSVSSGAPPDWSLVVSVFL